MDSVRVSGHTWTTRIHTDRDSPYSRLVIYARQQLFPVLSPITATSLPALKETAKVLVVGYFDGSDADSIEAFQCVATAHHREHIFGLCTDKRLAQVENITCPGLALYKNLDDRKIILQGGRTNDKDAIWSFVKSASTPLIIDIRPELHTDLIRVYTKERDTPKCLTDRQSQAGLLLGYIFLGTHSPEERSRLVALVRPFAVQYKDRIQFAFIDAQTSLDSVEDMHLNDSHDAHWPTFAIYDPAKGHRYLFDKKAQSMPTHQQLSDYLEAFFKGNLKRDINSKPVPVEPQPDAVKTIVGLTFDKLVLDETKDVFVEYYTQSCAPCKVMAPQWEKLAQLFKDDEEGCKKILVGKMDAEANDVSADIRGYPWLLLYPSSSKDRPVQYLGNRTVQDMALFVKEHGTHEVDAVRNERGYQ